MTVTVTVAATSLAYQLEVFRHMIANSATFRTVVGAADVAEAKNSIFYFWAEGETFPRAFVRHATSDDFDRISNTGFVARSTLIAGFEFDVPEAYEDNYQDAGLDFANKLGAIRDEIISFHVADTSGETLATDKFTAGEDFGQLDPEQNNGVKAWGGELFLQYRG